MTSRKAAFQRLRCSARQDQVRLFYDEAPRGPARDVSQGIWRRRRVTSIARRRINEKEDPGAGRRPLSALGFSYYSLGPHARVWRRHGFVGRRYLDANYIRSISESFKVRRQLDRLSNGR